MWLAQSTRSGSNGPGFQRTQIARIANMNKNIRQETKGPKRMFTRISRLFNTPLHSLSEAFVFSQSEPFCNCQNTRQRRRRRAINFVCRGNIPHFRLSSSVLTRHPSISSLAVLLPSSYSRRCFAIFLDVGSPIPFFQGSASRGHGVLHSLNGQKRKE